MNMFIKAAKGLGFPEFEISQIRYYAQELRGGAYELDGATNHVELATGQKPESFEQIGRRYLRNPSVIHPKLSNGGKLDALAFIFRMMASRAPNLDRWEQDRGHPVLNRPLLAQESKEWRSSAEKQQTNLLVPASVPKLDLTPVSYEAV